MHPTAPRPTPHPFRLSPRRCLGLIFASGMLLLAACANTGRTDAPASAAADNLAADSRASSLAMALPMPEASAYDTRYFTWEDSRRQRAVAAKLYWPVPALAPTPAGGTPLVVFSHGLGGSREGYSYLGKYWAAKGYASLHLQHVGSDRTLWSGNPISLVWRLQAAAQESEAIARVQDLSFALDQLLQGEFASRIDASRIVAAGHSYGANTTLLAAGAQVRRQVNGSTQVLDFRDPRIQAAVIISAPPFYGENDMAAILAPVQIPTLHITSTGDEITVPGYHSPPQDRIAVFDATHGPAKALAVFKDGSHSMFTDRLNTGGAELNPRVKAATRALALAFFQRVFDQQAQPMAQWAQDHQPLMARFEQRF